MPIEFDKLMALEIPDRKQSYTARDSMLYALGLGAGLDPLDQDELPFVYEAEQKALPTMAVVLAHPGFWVRDLETGIDWMRVVHGEQSLRIHQPLPVEGDVLGRNRIVDVVDKGEGRGALVKSERQIIDTKTDTLLATILQTTFCRSDGGFGGSARPKTIPHPIPDRVPDVSVETPTSTQGALIYRLSGDYNPLHADPVVAKNAGFDRPILHGLATYGVAGRAILQGLCDHDPTRLDAIECRFTAPVFPGETFRTDCWRDGNEVSFRVTAIERDVVAINNGRAVLNG